MPNKPLAGDERSLRSAPNAFTISSSVKRGETRTRLPTAASWSVEPSSAAETVAC